MTFTRFPYRSLHNCKLLDSNVEILRKTSILKGLSDKWYLIGMLCMCVLFIMQFWFWAEIWYICPNLNLFWFRFNRFKDQPSHPRLVSNVCVMQFCWSFWAKIWRICHKSSSGCVILNLVTEVASIMISGLQDFMFTSTHNSDRL